jgi:ATP-dependent helicase HepA
MVFGVVGQRCISEREPELGLGVVADVDPRERRIAVTFPATRERRLYALGTPVLKRIVFRAGETITGRDGSVLRIEAVEESEGGLTYHGGGKWLREDAISDVTSVSTPSERLMAGQTDASEVFELRFRALQAQARIRQSGVRGLLGGRVELIPHQFYLVHEVAARQIPRVLLADEVGLGKTIEACLILQRLLAVGQVKRALVLVPESLTHQWFVELLRRFNLWFSIYDEERCVALEDAGDNPFVAGQLVLCSIGFLAGNAVRGGQAIAAGWDLVIVDEAHHLAWAPDRVSPGYALVEKLAVQCRGLLLLTATPTQLGLAGHFARLRLLDPDRYRDFATFLSENERYGAVAAVADKIVEQRRLTPADEAALKRIFDRDSARLAQHLAALAEGRPAARESLLRTLLDQHGTGRVMFRNTRAAMSGFPPRRFCPAALPADGRDALLVRIARELNAEEADADAALRYSFRDDPRIDWLVGLLKEHRAAKILLICRSARKVAAIEAALQEKLKVKSAVFHEGLALVQRDRNAAWFAEPDGAQLLLCSEIGSEGRNFQFAHHLVLFDLPLSPGLVEQRIGRLDRIGQTETIRIHVPYITGSADECVVEWYHRGVDAFETPVHGGEEYAGEFRARLLQVAAAYAHHPEAGQPQLERLVADTQAFRENLNAKMRQGRDRLLELNSFDPAVARRVIDRVRHADADLYVRNLLLALLDHFGVRVKEYEEGDVFLDPAQAYVEGFPSIPPEGMLATFDRKRAIAREDIRFLSADHPVLRDALDLLIDSPAGTTAFGTVEAETPNLVLEAVYLLEPVAEVRWNVDQFLAPTPVRVVTDVRGQDLTASRDVASYAGYVSDGDLHRFLERPEFSSDVLNRMVEAAGIRAEARGRELTTAAAGQARETLTANVRRLEDLRQVNPNVRRDEIALAAEQLDRTCAAITGARLRLDSIRLIVETAS